MKTRAMIFFGVAVAGLAGWAFVWRANEQRRGEIAGLRERVAEVRRLRSEQARLRAVQPSAEELEKLHEEQDAVQRLRAEIGRLRGRAEERARGVAAQLTAASKRAPSMTEEFVAAAEWRNAGKASPTEAMETALWAAAGGDLKTLAATIVLEPAAREKAHRVLDRLPREVSTPSATAEDFVALLTTADVPLSEARLIEPKFEQPLPDGRSVRVVEFRDEKGQPRTVPVQLLRVNPTEWRLLVPPAAIDRYAASLHLQ